MPHEGTLNLRDLYLRPQNYNEELQTGIPMNIT
jgi:hypothetical protein